MTDATQAGGAEAAPHHPSYGGASSVEAAASAVAEYNDGPLNQYQEAKKALVVTTEFNSSVLATSEMRTKMHDPDDLVELARFVQNADSHVKSIVGGKLELIQEQIRALQGQAQRVLSDARRDLELSHAKCNFQRRPGYTYHLYRKETSDGEMETFFSMLSPNEWSGNPPHEYVDSYRLEYDMSWTQVDRIEQRDKARQFNPVLLGLTRDQLKDSIEGPAPTGRLGLTLV